MIYSDERLGQEKVVHMADLNILQDYVGTWGRERRFFVHLYCLAHDSVERKDVFAGRRTP